MNWQVNWTSLGIALLNFIIGGAVVAFIRSRPALARINSEREANLLSERAKEMDEMRKRIERLEAAAKEKDQQHADDKEAIRREFDAVISIYRHRTNNIDASFNALLLLLKKGVPVGEAVEAIEKMRAEQLAREAVEAATMRAAGINITIDPT